MLLASGAALVAGLLLIYVPGSRHPAALLGAVVVLLGIGMLYPEPTLLFAQAVILGLALTLVAGLLERSVARRRRRIAQFPEPSGLACSKPGCHLRTVWRRPAAKARRNRRRPSSLCPTRMRIHERQAVSLSL